MPIEQLILNACALLGSGILILCGSFAILSWREGQPRAASRAILLAVLLPIPFWMAAWIPFPGRLTIAAILLVLTVALLLILLLPFGRTVASALTCPKNGSTSAISCSPVQVCSRARRYSMTITWTTRIKRNSMMPFAANLV